MSRPGDYPHTPPSPILALTWVLAGVVLLSVLPSQWRLQAPGWRLPPNEGIQVAVALVLFGLLALQAALMTWRHGRRRMAAGILVSAPLLFGLAIIALRWAELPVSRAVALASLALAVPLVIAPYWVGRRLPLATTALVIIAGLAAGFARDARGDENPTTTLMRSALHPLHLIEYRGLVPTDGAEAGAIAAHGDGYLVVNGAGRIFHLEWSPPSTAPTLVALPLTLPFNREEYLSDTEGIGGVPRFRVTDLLVREASGSSLLVVAHMYWHRAEQCLTLRVSSASLPGSRPQDTPASAWTTLFESRPCHRVGETTHDNQSGGQLAWWGPDGLLLSVGDHGYEGLNAPAFSQDTSVDYGKVLEVRPNGTSQRFTIGHRNIQGLVVATDGRVWATEQGPQGGDELNLLVRGGNYGWPLATYGTNYGSEQWALGTGGWNHGTFVEPAMAFVPSLALTSVIQVTGAGFTRWRGDLLAGSLRAESLHRIRTLEDRVTYVEPIPVGHRIRDLAEGRDGRIVLWTDPGHVIVLSSADLVVDGRLAYGRCANCHGESMEGTAIGPPLRGIVGRRVAGYPGFPFSPALRAAGGTWTDDRLDAFLRDPRGWAPGTAMVLEPLTDPAERLALIEFLRRQ